MQWVMWIDPVDMDSVHFGAKRYRSFLVKYDYLRVFSITGDDMHECSHKLRRSLAICGLGKYMM